MFDKVVDIISEHQGIEKNTITPETHLVADLALNSYDLVDLICKFEGVFDIEVSDRKIKSFQTINDIVVFLEEIV